MSKRFKATSMFQQVDDIYDMPAGTIWCIDVEGDWFHYVNPHEHDAASRINKGDWPAKHNGVITLFRDYWRSTEVKNSIGAPYYDALRAMKKRVIK